MSLMSLRQIPPADVSEQVNVSYIHCPKHASVSPVLRVPAVCVVVSGLYRLQTPLTHLLTTRQTLMNIQVSATLQAL